MSATNQLLDKFRKTCSTASDNAIAVSLGLSRTAVSRWVHGKGAPDAASVEKMANAIDEPIGPWLALIEAERADRAGELDNKRVWLRLASTLGAIFSVALMVTLPAQIARAAKTTTAQVQAQSRHLHQCLMAWLKLFAQRSFRHALRTAARPA